MKLGRDRTVADICQSIQDWLSTGKSADIFSPITVSYFDVLSYSRSG